MRHGTHIFSVIPRFNLLTGDAITHFPSFDVWRQGQVIAFDKIKVMLVCMVSIHFIETFGFGWDSK